MKAIKRWMIINPKGELTYQTYTTRGCAQVLNRMAYNGTGKVIRVEIREVERAK